MVMYHYSADKVGRASEDRERIGNGQAIVFVGGVRDGLNYLRCHVV
jgi:hypothetical protein